MDRRWISFDKEITDREFQALPQNDRISLFEAMKRYRKDIGKGYVIKNYGDGVLMINPKEGQGRCLFFSVVEIEHVHLGCTPRL